MSGDIATKTIESFARANLAVLACAHEASGAVDLAIVHFPARACVIRCVTTATANDGADLTRMLAQGDFSRAVLVYEDRERADVSGEIEAWHVSEVDRLAVSLANEGAGT